MAGCQAGLSVVGMDSVGNVRGCESLQDDSFIEGNLRSESLTEIWHKEGNFPYNRNFSVDSLTGACRECDKAPRRRGGCRGMQHFVSPSGGENPYCCYPGKPPLVNRTKGSTMTTIQVPPRSRFLPLTPERWGDFGRCSGKIVPVTNAGACGGGRRTPDSCRTGRGQPAGHEEIVRSGVVPGIIAYDGITPVGWCSVAPRRTSRGSAARGYSGRSTMSRSGQ